MVSKDDQSDSDIGKPLYIYQPTTSKSRLAYTRVCIEVNPHN